MTSSERPATRATALACAAIALAVSAVYAQVSGHQFVDYDDGLYITSNATVRSGLSPDTFVWAWLNTEAFLWHPLTWLSYLADADLYGVGAPGSWLLENVAWHVAGCLALLGALVSLTGRLGPSAFATALFALHPIQTEAVAWASGRKELLAGLLTFLTIWSYARYTRQRSRPRYALVLGLAFLCLAAKGTQVALPFLLLVLDYWPLRRMPLPGSAGRGAVGASSFENLVVEKLPLFLMAFGTVLLQYGPVSTTYGPWLADPSLFERAQDGVVAYAATFGRLMWPDGLAIVYPTRVQMGLPRHGSLVVAALLVALAAATLGAMWVGRRRGYVTLGWLWFVGMLFPMVGLVPSGLRVMHDRYAYVPMIGLAVLVAFGAGELTARWRVPRPVIAALAVAVLSMCAIASFRQAGVWQDSDTLFDHALAVTERNAIVHFYRGNTRFGRSDPNGAIAEYEAALAIYPEYPDANHNLGRVHLRGGRPDLALPHLERAAAVRPRWTELRVSLAQALWATGERERAVVLLETAVAEAPANADARRALERMRRAR